MAAKTRIGVGGTVRNYALSDTASPISGLLTVVAADSKLVVLSDNNNRLTVTVVDSNLTVRT